MDSSSCEENPDMLCYLYFLSSFFTKNKNNPKQNKSFQMAEHKSTQHSGVLRAGGCFSLERIPCLQQRRNTQSVSTESWPLQSMAG